MTLTRYLPGWPPALGIAVLTMLAMPQAALGSEFKPGFGYTSLSKGLFDRCSIVMKSIAIVCLVWSFAFNAFAEETVNIATGEWTPFLSKKLEHGGPLNHIITKAFAFGRRQGKVSILSVETRHEDRTRRKESGGNCRMGV